MSKDDDKKLMEELEAKFQELFGAIDDEDDPDDFDDFDDLDDLDDFDNTIILNDENGNEIEFELLDIVEYEGENYIVLLPAEDSDDSGEVVILRVDESDDDEEEAYTSVEDVKVLENVFNIFKEKFKAEFNFED